MSFDLAVFSPDDAPREQEAFMAWCTQQMKWESSKSYDDPASLNADLQAFYGAMIKEFPAMNGPDAKPLGEIADDEELDPRTTDYCGVDGFLYLGFRWSVMEEAHDFVRKTAQETGVGFFDVSDGEAEPEFPGLDAPEEPRVPTKRGFFSRLFGSLFGR